MGLVSKLKNILFEEEEVEIPVLEKKEKVVSSPRVKELPKKEEVRPVSTYNDFYNETQEVPSLPPKEKKEEAPVRSREEIKSSADIVSEREMFKSEKTFNFPAFDEEEFESSMPRRTTNVLEHERKKSKDKAVKAQVVKKEEVKEVKPKFRPSPIISPVYGILDKNYTPDEITTRETIPKALDVDSVRKKAFGTLEEEIIDVPEPKYLKKDEDEEQFLEEKLEKARTIDELLKDSSDEILEVQDNNFEETAYNINDYEEELQDTLSDSLDKSTIDNESLNETIDSLDEDLHKKQISEEEDTLENDLFDLIDSMYENREDGE